MNTINGSKWLEVNYGDLPAMWAKQLLAERGYNHSFLRRLPVSELMKLVQEKIGNLIPAGGVVGKLYNGYGDVYLTMHDLEKVGDKAKLKAKNVAEGWWSISCSGNRTI